MKKKAPLMVVATLDPKSIGEHNLARYSTAEGDFITNAGLKFIFSPFTGKEVNASKGVTVTTKINEAKAIGVLCNLCKSVNATTNTSRSEIFCVTCGTHLAYDLEKDGLDEDDVNEMLDASAGASEDELDIDDKIGGDDITEDDSDDKSEESEMMDDTEGLDDSDDEDEDKEAIDAGPLDDFMNDEDTEACDQKAVVDMTDMVDEDDDVEILSTATQIIAMVSGHVVATMALDNTNVDNVQTAGFAKGFKHTVALKGLKKALVSAGFKPKRILVKDVAALAVKRATKAADRQVASLQVANEKRFAECLEIAAAGGVVGMFSKENAGVIHAELSKVLAGVNITNAKKVARTVLSKVLAQHNKALITIASDLMKKEDAVLSTYREQIASMGGNVAEPDEEDDTEEDPAVDDEDVVTSRLTTPMRVSNKVRQNEVAALNKNPLPFSGTLFTS